MAVQLQAERRNDLKKSATKEARNKGQLPAVLYGKGKETKAISLDSIELVKTIRDEGRNAIISLKIEGESPVDVMLHDYQMDPIKDELLHADFYIVDMSEKMDVEVSLNLEGEAEGARDGGVLQQPLYELQVRAKPREIPDEISVDISELKIGDSITVADLETADNYEILDDPETTIATVLAPDTMDDIEEETPDEDQEPELVGAEEESEEEEENN